MEKAFLHEKLKNPDMESNEMMREAMRLYKAYLEAIFEFRQTEEFGLLNYDQIPENIFYGPLKRHFGNIDEVLMQAMRYFCLDGNMAVLNQMSFEFFYGKPRSFLFAKDFWTVLKRTKLDNISWDMLPRSFAATFRFPEPLRDSDHDPIHEVMMSIQPRELIEKYRRGKFKPEDGDGSRVFIAWWICGDEDGAIGSVLQLIPDGMDKITPETWSKKYFVRRSYTESEEVELKDRTGTENLHKELIKALFYVCSGDPDIRSERNRIMYKPGTLSPISVHRHASRANYEKVGWNWMKKIQAYRYTKDQWMVEPFARYQPYGPRDNPSYRWIIVEGHTRQRKQQIDDGLSL